MPFAHFDQFFTFVAAGLGLLLAGGLNLALGRSGRRVLLRVVVTLAVCGAVVSGLPRSRGRNWLSKRRR